MSNWDDDKNNADGWPTPPTPPKQPEEPTSEEPAPADPPADAPEQWALPGDPQPAQPNYQQPAPDQWQDPSPPRQQAPQPGQWQPPQQPAQPGQWAPQQQAPGQWSPQQPPQQQPPQQQAPQPGQWSPGGAQQPPPSPPPGYQQNYQQPYQQSPQGQWSPAATPRPANGQFTLGPLTVADILDTTFSLFRACWKQLAIAVLVFAVPAGILSTISKLAEGKHSIGFGTGVFANLSNFGGADGKNLSDASVAAVAIASLLGFVLTVVLQPYVTGAITRIVAAKYLGRDMPARDAFKSVTKLWPRFIGATLLTGLCTAVGLITLVGWIAIAVLFTVVIPIIAIEEEGVFNAMGRSWALMKRRFWGYLGIRILMFIVAGFTALIAEIVPLVLGSICYAVGADPIGAFFLGIGQVLGNLVALPVSAIVATLIYFDSRVRNEGFDVQMMAARMPQNPQ